MTDNEVLAEFMGHEEGYDEHGVWQKLKYDSDFRQLMPVWYKFKELVVYPDKSDHRNYMIYYNKIHNAILHSGCAEASKLLAEGIRWYNTIKK